MADQNDTGERVSGSNGGTSGTFATETSGSAVGAGAVGQDGGTSGGEQWADSTDGAGQGDDLAGQLGGEGQGGSTPMTPQSAASGDMSAGRSEGSAEDPNPAALGAGDVGGMGGARASHTHGNPPGGVSPMGSSKN